MISFAVYTAAQTQCFQWAGQPPNCPFSWGSLIHGSLCPRMSAPPKRHLDRLSRFCTARPCDQHRQTDRQTTLCATYVAIDRIYALLRAGNAAWKVN